MQDRWEYCYKYTGEIPPFIEVESHRGNEACLNRLVFESIRWFGDEGVEESFYFSYVRRDSVYWGVSLGRLPLKEYQRCLKVRSSRSAIESRVQQQKRA